MARDIPIRFALNAALTSGFTAAFQSASSCARGVAASVREMERSATGRLGASIASQRDKIRGLSGNLREARSTLATLQGQAQTAGGATGILARQIAQAERRVNNLSGALNRQLGTWRETMAEAATLGGSVRRLTEEYGRLQSRMEHARRIAGALGANQAQAEALRNQRADLQGRLLSTMATTASVAVPVKLAISAEDTFADLRKVMDVPEEVMLQVFTDAQEMSNRTGKSFEDVINIMTSAAQSGLGKTREELLGVADQAVKMSIAWGVSVEQAGESMARWRSSMEMTDEQAKHTANVINALSNSMAAEAGELNQIFIRIGSLMKGSGVETQDIAALASAFKAAGAEVEVAGTAMKNFTSVLAAGSSGMTDKQLKLMKFIKIDPDELQKEFYYDSKKAISRVLESLKNNVRPEELNSISMNLFGKESIAAISPLINNLDLLKESFAIANGNVDGSVDEEYANRMKTTQTALSQMTQTIRNLGITAGKTLLPAVGAIARGITGVVGTIGNLVERFPGISSAVMITGAAIASFAIGSLALGLVMNTVRSSINSVRGVVLRLAASQVRATGTTAGFGLATRIAGAGARFFAGGLRSILLASGVGALLVGLGFGIKLLIDNWDAVTEAMENAWNWVTDIWGRLPIFFTELGNNLVQIFPEAWQSICDFATSAKDWIVSVWTGLTEFFTGIGQAISDIFFSCWDGVNGGASWAFEGIAAIWNGAVEFFSGIVAGISGVFTGLFDWLREKFAWVFSAIDAISGFVGKITGAVSNAWDKAFGGSDKKPEDKPVTSTAAATSGEKPLAPVAQGKIAKPEPDRPSFAKFLEQEKGAKKVGGGGGGSRKRGAAGSSAGTSTGRGPVTVVTLGGDNNSPQTIFIPSSGGNSQIPMPAVAAARKMEQTPRVLPRTPGMLEKISAGKKQQSPNSIMVDLKQNFDLIAQDAAAVKKVLEALRPDFEVLVRNALERLQSDRRRTAYGQ